MEASAIFHSMDRRWGFALEPGRFLFRIKAKKGDLRCVTLHTVDKYIPLQLHDTRESFPMEKAASDAVSDYFEAVISMDVVCLRYYFRLEDRAGNILYYGNNRFWQEAPTHIDNMFDCPQNLREEELFEIPQWAANKVIYQIFPARFASSQEVPDKVWYQAPMRRGADLKGDLPGILHKLPYLRELGVDVLYFTPIFEADSDHKYDTVDYFKIDPAFGTEEDLRRLVEKAHSLGMRVILDAVFNHTSRNFFAFRDILEKGGKSEYLDWYYIKSFPLTAHWGQKPTYKTFSYYGGMPKLNVRNPQVESYLLDVARYWIRTCHIDGWRLDVGDEVNHNFWKQFRRAVKEENPDALIVGETWHTVPDFLDGDEWDSVMNYDFRNAVLDFAVHGSITPTEFLESLGFLRGNLHTKVNPVLWNLVGSHDTERIGNLCGKNKEKWRLCAALQLLLPGMPMVYYGDEVGLAGGPDPDCRRGMLWEEKRQDRELFSWYQKLITVRRENPAVTEDRIAQNLSDDGKKVLAFTRESAGCRVTLVFYGGSFPCAWQGARGFDVLSGEIYSGTLKPYQVLVLV